MADEVEMTPVAGAEPPKADPLAKPVADKPATIKLTPVERKPGVAPSPALKPGLKLPTQTALKPGLKLPPKPGLGAGLKLPPKPGLKLPTQTALKPGLRLPPKPGVATSSAAVKPGLKLPTQTVLKPGVKLPPKPVIRKPGATVAAAPLPKPVTPVAAAKPAESVAEKPVVPVSVDAQGVGKLPTVSAATVAREDAAPDLSAIPKPMEALKSVTQKLKGITQEIPQQAVLHKTGIISEGGMSESQREAAKHKTARISLSDAMGVAPVKNDAAPMKTIRIKRPINIPTPTPTSTLTPQPKLADAPAAAAGDQDKTLKVASPTGLSSPAAPAAPAAEAAAEKPAAPAPTVTQRKTLKITRPGGMAVRPGGKFGIKRPTQATTVAKTDPAAPAAEGAPAEDAVADIPDIPNIPEIPAPAAAAPVVEAGPAWLWTLSTLVQLAACVAIGALAWFLYENTQTHYF